MVEVTYSEALMYRNLIEKAAGSLADEDALEVPMLFPRWKADVAYAAGDRVYYEGTLYKVLIAHTSQADWTPDIAPSLFAEVLIPDPEVIPDWVQPDSTNPYMKGDKVRFKDDIYESLIDNNVWSPADYPAGWQLITP